MKQEESALGKAEEGAGTLATSSSPQQQTKEESPISSAVDEAPKESAVDDSSSPSKSPSPDRRRKRIYLSLGFLAILGLILFAILFPLLRNKKNNDDIALTNSNSQKSSTATPGEGEEVDDPPPGPGEEVDAPPPGPGEESDGNATAAADSFVTIDGVFPATLRLFNEEALEGYDIGAATATAGKSELEQDIENATWFLISNVAMRNLGVKGYESVGFGFNDIMFRGRPGMDIMPIALDAPIAFAPGPPEMGAAPAPRPAPGPAPKTSSSEDHYGTNNQEEGVEEGDEIVSDGENVYAKYGDYVVVWDATSGEMKTSVKLPSVETIRSEWDAVKGGTNGSQRRPSYYYGNPHIQSLLLHENRLLVISGGYGYALRPLDTLMNEFLGTHVRVYDTSSLKKSNDNNEKGELKLLDAKNINGRFNAVRSVGGNVHLVTSTGINVYRPLVEPFERWNMGSWNLEEIPGGGSVLNDDEYIKQVESMAREKVIPEFVNQLQEELQVTEGKLPNLAKISLWQSEASDNRELESRMFGNGLINNLVQVHSFDITADASETTPLLEFSITGSFLPTSWSQVYAAKNDLIIAGEGWEYDPAVRTSQEATYLLGLATDGASTRLGSVGKLRGRVMNSYSMDVLDNILRVATTVRNTWFLRPMPMVRSLQDADALDEEIEKEQVIEILEPESTTKNYITLLELPDDLAENGKKPSVMDQRGQLTLGEPNEVFTAVRYFDNIAYAVTFERTDPFYVLNLSNPDDPEVLAELKISGFSSYLHSMNADNSLILAIGQEADENGRVEGMKITVFDSRDPRKPFAIQNYVIEQDLATYSNSEALRNFKAARYANGRLIIPVDISNWQDRTQDFRGFVVFVVNENTIEEECRISHDNPKDIKKEEIDELLPVPPPVAEGAEESTVVEEAIPILIDQPIPIDLPCQYCPWLPRRSMIFNGLLMTTDKATVQTTDTNTCQNVWRQKVDVGANCCY